MQLLVIREDEVVNLRKVKNDEDQILGFFFSLNFLSTAAKVLVGAMVII